MARATWSGFLSFGLVSVPVGLFSATTDQTIHFNQLHKNTSNRVRYKKVDEETGEELSTEDIVNGYPLGGASTSSSPAKRWPMRLPASPS